MTAGRLLHATFAASLTALTAAAFASTAQAQVANAAAPAAEAPAPYVVDVVAEDYAFDAPDAIPSGWVTLRFNNTGEETHFVFLTRLPDGRTYDQYIQDVGEVFSDVWEGLKSREIYPPQAGERLGEEVPEWFWGAEQMGGVGLVDAGGTAETTLKLKPGTYVMECYMKTQEGDFHGMEGMAHPLTVTEEASGASEPTADIKITLSNYAMDIEGDLTPGRHMVAVNYAEEPEVGFGHDVHVARLHFDGQTDVVLPWMSWLNVHGLENPAPTEFIGGAHDMPVGYTSYFTLDLEPGEYLFISEETGPMGVLKQVTVEQ